MTFRASLDGTFALVAGGSRGVGKGIAEELCDSGATVSVTGRSVDRTEFESECTPVVCDHTDDAAVAAVFERLLAETGRLDILVNSVWGGYERMVEDGEWTWERPFWEQPLHRWDSMFGSGVRAAFATSRLAARAMVEQGSGLIVNLSYWSARKRLGNVPYGAAKAATDKMTADMAEELRGHGVAVVSLYPGLVRTEAVMQAADVLDLSNSESARFSGRAIAALVGDPRLPERSGSVVVTAALAEELGFADVDGSRPRPLALDDA